MKQNPKSILMKPKEETIQPFQFVFVQSYAFPDILAFCYNNQKTASQKSSTREFFYSSYNTNIYQYAYIRTSDHFQSLPTSKNSAPGYWSPFFTGVKIDNRKPEFRYLNGTRPNNVLSKYTVFFKSNSTAKESIAREEQTVSDSDLTISKTNQKEGESAALRLACIRLAISQVMARNVSHNIGSHVLSGMGTREGLKRLSPEISDACLEANQYQVLPRLAQNGQTGYNIEDYIAFFNAYIKVRMDFLADVVTSTPTLESVRLLLQEVMAGFDKNRILLNRISGINDFKFRFVIRDCRHLLEGQSLDEGPEFTRATDIPIAIVNDILGQHAFYVILENIIRNTAKHARIENGQEVIFTIAISECEEDHSLYKCSIYDNCPLSNYRIDELVYIMNNRLLRSILKEDFTLRDSHLGLIEMSVCFFGNYIFLPGCYILWNGYCQSNKS